MLGDLEILTWCPKNVVTMKSFSVIVKEHFHFFKGRFLVNLIPLYIQRKTSVVKDRL